MTLWGLAEPRDLVSTFCTPAEVMTAAGVQNVLTKSLGSANPHNVIKATFDALIQLRNKAEVAALRGKAVEEL